MVTFKNLKFEKHHCIDDAIISRHNFKNGYSIIVQANKRYHDGKSYIHKFQGHEHLEIKGNRDYKDKKLIKESYQVVLIDKNDNIIELDESRKQVLQFASVEEINELLKIIDKKVESFLKNIYNKREKYLLDLLELEYEK
tara:strand:- start:2581 stop:3000 length:420 start_codon:yes stop_codon:yes gene_type:complete